jgi:activating signal cointegrator 1
MKALSLWQPWASLIADGTKKIETRSWPLNHRGPLAIHATKKIDKDACIKFGYDPLVIPRGCIVCLVSVDDCVKFPNVLAPPDEYGDFSPGRYGFLLSIIEVFDKPIPARGMQGIFILNQALAMGVGSRMEDPSIAAPYDRR